MKTVSASLLIVLIFVSCSDSRKVSRQSNPFYKNSEDSAIVAQRTLLKNYAFCKCLDKSHPADSALKSDGSIDGYLELGTYSNRAYEIVNSYIEKVMLLPYRSKDRHSLGTMRCLDMYNNPELDSLIKTLDKYRE